MKNRRCLNLACPLRGKVSSGNIVRHGFYRTRFGKRRRYRCGECGKTFSSTKGTLSIIIINPGLDSRARTALEHMLESVVSARGKVLRTNFSATSRVTRATKLTQAASRHSYRWCNPPTRGCAFYLFIRAHRTC